jgi:hypothetical protein
MTNRRIKTTETPEQIATKLILAGFTNEQILWLLDFVGSRFGWDDTLNEVGLIILKPHVPKGKDRRNA